MRAPDSGGPLSRTGLAVRSRMPIGFGLALVLLVGLGIVTQASITDLVAANAAVARSLHAIERLQALEAGVRELEASRARGVVTGRAPAPGTRLRRPSRKSSAWIVTSQLLDSPRQRGRLRQVGVLTNEVSVFLRARVRPAAGEAAGGRRAGSGPQNGLVSDRLVAAIDEIEREERGPGRARGRGGDRARTAASQVLVASVLGFVTILTAGLMVRRDVLERRKATQRLEVRTRPWQRPSRRRSGAATRSPASHA